MSKIAGDLAETFDPSGSNSILGLGLKEELKQSNMIDKEEENKKIDSENENDKNVKFLNDLIKSSEEKNKAKDYVREYKIAIPGKGVISLTLNGHAVPSL